MSALLVGFDSAWTPKNAGAIVGAFLRDDGSFRELGPPLTANFREAERLILEWQTAHAPTSTVVLLDQPTIVTNPTGARPVECIVGSAVSRRRGGMQPANTARTEMFGTKAPVWAFLNRFGGPADPLDQSEGTRVLETYPTLAIISLGWLLQDPRPGGRLPRYNPGRKKMFSLSDWRCVCGWALAELSGRRLVELETWIARAALIGSPRKGDQDKLDACLCLLVALLLAEGKDCLMVGDLRSGYIVVPYEGGLAAELCRRCTETNRTASEWVRAFRWPIPRV